MDKQAERYNEISLDTFARITIDHAILDGLKEQKRRATVEISFSTLPEKLVLTLSAEPPELPEKETKTPTTFRVNGCEIDVHHPKLGQALQFLTPKDRAIILLYYFLNMKDAEIGEVLDISRSTAQRHHTSAQEKLKLLLRNLK